MIGAKLMLEKQWLAPGVFNMEQFDPDPFMAAMTAYGLPWKVVELDDFSLDNLNLNDVNLDEQAST
jgi:saccharopine dehydrogenase (NAD+, L-lysine-forming)